MISGQEFEVVVTEGDSARTLQVLSDLKTQVKRFLVDLNDVASYIIGLKHAYYQSHALEITAFTTLCHLITRISMQDPTRLGSFSNLILPFLLERLADARLPVAQTTKKSLRTFWGCIGTADDAFLDIIYSQGFQNDNHRIQVDILDVLNGLLSTNGGNFYFKPYIKATVELLDSPEPAVQKSATDVLLTFFQRVNPYSRSAKLDLIDLLRESKVNDKIAVRLLETIGGMDLVDEYHHNEIVVNETDNKDISMVEINGMHDQLSSMLEKTPFWPLDRSITSTSFDSNMLSEIESSITLPFNGKETELNWKLRQDWIIKMRSMLRSIRGNSLLQELFANFIKQVREFIVKGLMSLRTTLSNNACQLCKEIGVFLGLDIDFATFDIWTNALLKLCAGRKTIQHQNSNAAIIGLILNCNISSKFIPLLTATIQEKNTQPKIYIGQWIHLLMLKFYDVDDLNAFDRFVESLEPIIIKGISDSQAQVRESMRIAFWCLNELSPQYAERIKSRLDVNITRALENSRVSAQPRKSVKELISERKRQTQREMLEKENIEPYTHVSLSNVADTARVSSTETEKPINDPHVQPSAKDVERPNDEYEDFTERSKRQNMIYNDISSSSSEDQYKGLCDLMKLNSNKQLNYKLHSALNDLTYLNPVIFWKVFENDEWIKKLSNYLKGENLLRVYCVHFHDSEGPSKDQVSLILENMKVEDFCLSIDSILRNCTDTFKIDDLKLSIQYNKYKESILRVSLILLKDLFLFKGDEIRAYLLSSIFDAMHVCLPTIEDSLKPIYFEVLQIGYEKWQEEYIRSLEKCKEEVRAEINQVLNVFESESKKEELIGFATDVDEYDAENLEHMTKLLPKPDEIRRLLEENGQVEESVEDFTKIIPKWKREPATDELKQVFDSIEEEDESESTSNKFAVDAMELELPTGSVQEVPNEDKVPQEENVGAVSVEIIEDTDIQHPSDLENEEDEKLLEEMEEEPLTDLTPELETLDINQSDTAVDEGSNNGLLLNWKEDIETNGQQFTHLLGLSNEELLERLESELDECPILSIMDSRGMMKEDEVLHLVLAKPIWSPMAYFMLQESISKYIHKVSTLVSNVKFEHQQYYSLVLERLVELVDEDKVTGEDVFLMERLLSKSTKDENTLIRMNGFQVYSKLYKIHKEGKIDTSNGYPIVDEMIFRDINVEFLEMMLL